MDKPKRERICLPNDTSTESAQLAFADNSNGMLGPYDEIVNFFGARSRYAGRAAGAEQSSRGFWLSTYDSDQYSMLRVSRAEIDCRPSLSIIGGVQPRVLHELTEEAQRNDGLVQRFNPVMMPPKPPKPIDKEPKFPLTIYEKLIRDMYLNCPLRETGATLHFSPNADTTKSRFFDWVDQQVSYFEDANPPLAAHLNKFKGMFLRFCGLFHMIENFRDKQPRLIGQETASRVYKLMTGPRLSHAQAFYALLKENEEADDLQHVAEYILAHRLEIVSAREMQQGSARLRKISTRDIAQLAGTLVSLGWLYPIVGKRIDSFNWKVNADVHRKFTERAGLIRTKFAERQAIAKANFDAARDKKSDDDAT